MRLPLRSTIRPRRREIERHHRNFLLLDVAPDIKFGPIGERKNADRFARRNAAIVEVPQFRPLVFRIPDVVGGAEGEHAFLGAASFLVAAGAAERGIEPVLRQRLLQRFGLHDVRIERRAVGKRIDPLREAVTVHVHDQTEPEPRRGLVAKADHLAKLPRCIDVQKRKRRFRRKERLSRQMQQNGRILADRVEQNRLAEFRRHLAEYMKSLPLPDGAGREAIGGRSRLPIQVPC